MMIRPAEVNDIPDIIRFGMNEVVEVGGAAIGWGAHAESIARNTQGCIEGRVPGVALVAETDGKIVGMFICSYTNDIRDERKYCAREVTMYVLPGFRGQGIATRLRLEAMKITKSRGIRYFWQGVMIRPENQGVVEKLCEEGWKPVSTQMIKDLWEE